MNHQSSNILALPTIHQSVIIHLPYTQRGGG